MSGLTNGDGISSQSKSLTLLGPVWEGRRKIGIKIHDVAMDILRNAPNGSAECGVKDAETDNQDSNHGSGLLFNVISIRLRSIFFLRLFSSCEICFE